MTVQIHNLVLYKNKGEWVRRPTPPYLLAVMLFHNLANQRAFRHLSRDLVCRRRADIIAQILQQGAGCRKVRVLIYKRAGDNDLRAVYRDLDVRQRDNALLGRIVIGQL